MKAFQRIDRAVQEGCYIPNRVFYALLKQCIDEEDLLAAKELHRLVLRSGIDVNSFLISHLIRMFASCGSLLDATQIFETIQKPNVFAWSAILLAHVKFGQNEEAINLYKQMNCCDVEPDDHVFVAALKACGSGSLFQQGKMIHMDVLCGGFDSGLYVANAVIDMYCKCWSVLDGLRVFESMSKKDLVTWNSMLSGHAQHGDCNEALDLFQRMQHEGVKPNVTTWNILISGLAQQGQNNEASRLVQNMKEKGTAPNNATWNGLIVGYAKSGLFEDAVTTYQQMQLEGHKPDHVTLLCILRAFKRGTLEEEIQSRVLQLLHPSSTGNIGSERNLIDMARSVFDRLQRRPLESWNAMITAYADREVCFEAFYLFEQMLQQGIQPNTVTFIGILKACSTTSSLGQIKLIHATAAEHQFDKDMLVGSSLIDAYSKCGSINNACSVFAGLPKRDEVTWTVLIAAYTQHGLYTNALEQLYQMQCEGVEPNRVTFLFYLKACSNLATLDLGLLGHAIIVMNGWESDPYVGSSLIDMYVKCESFIDARLVFEKLPGRLPVAWNVMIAGCTQCGQSWEAIHLFQQMQQVGLEPNQTSYLNILKVCATSAALTQGKLFHAFSIEVGFEVNAEVNSALVDMYSKCGSIEDAYKVFVGMQERDIIVWNAMIVGYAKVGDHRQALRCFEELQREGVKADSVTFICLLSLCSHMGLKDKGRSIFMSMMQDQSVALTLEHYNCMVDLFGNAGLLNEAEDCLYTMPPTSNIVGWTSLLSHCERHIDGERGQRCFIQF